MSNAIIPQDAAAAMEQVVMHGDLSKLNAAQRLDYYRAVCTSTGLNPMTRPFDYIMLNNKLTLYARKDATDQLRKIHGVSISIVQRERLDDVYIVTARGTMMDGRSDESTGVVSLGNLRGDAMANALMKAETKAKRRVTLSICGLGWLDETEVGTIPDARPVHVNMDTGEILGAPPPIEAPRQPVKPLRERIIDSLCDLAGQYAGLDATYVPPRRAEWERLSDDDLTARGKELKAWIATVTTADEDVPFEETATDD